MKDLFVKCGYKGRTFATSGDISLSEVGNGRDPRLFSDTTGVTKLKAKARVCLRGVMDSLPVAPNCDDVGGVDTCASE